MDVLYPIKFTPQAKYRIWGGYSLKTALAVFDRITTGKGRSMEGITDDHNLTFWKVWMIFN